MPKKLILSCFVGVVIVWGLILIFTHNSVNQSVNAKENKAQLRKSHQQVKQTWIELFQNHLDWKVLEHGLNRVVMKNNEESWLVNLTVEEDLQKFIQKKLERYDVDFGAIAAIDPKTGAVVGLTSYSNRDNKHDYSLRAAFPAASIFKIITASAVLEYKKWNQSTNIRFQGNSKYVTESNSSTPGGASKMSLYEAFAKSTNLVFGKIGRMVLNEGLLLRKANDYGFSQEIPFDMPLDFSKIHFENEELAVAKTAAGLGDVSLSPVHAAMIAACISNHGVMMKPYIVQNVINEKHEQIYQVKSEVWKHCLNETSVKELRSIMKSTIDIGTARKTFSGYSNHSVLKKINMGGKTGSLTNTKLDGWNEWFVGYGEDEEDKLAVGIVIVSQKYWKVKPTQLSKDIFEYYFSKKRQKDKKIPKVIEIRSNLNEKRQ